MAAMLGAAGENALLTVTVDGGADSDAENPQTRTRAADDADTVFYDSRNYQAASGRISKPCEVIVVPIAVPPERTRKTPLFTVASMSVPPEKTRSWPLPSMMVPMAMLKRLSPEPEPIMLLPLFCTMAETTRPPADTTSKPCDVIAVRLAVPPAETNSLPRSTAPLSVRTLNMQKPAGIDCCPACGPARQHKHQPADDDVAEISDPGRDVVRRISFADDYAHGRGSRLLF